MQRINISQFTGAFIDMVSSKFQNCPRNQEGQIHLFLCSVVYLTHTPVHQVPGPTPRQHHSTSGRLWASRAQDCVWQEKKERKKGQAEHPFPFLGQPTLDFPVPPAPTGRGGEHSRAPPTPWQLHLQDRPHPLSWGGWGDHLWHWVTEVCSPDQWLTELPEEAPVCV